jgi:heat shock protein HslJ/uncharacterized membrane protein
MMVIAARKSLIAALAVAVLGAPGALAAETLNARGNEPFWRMTLSEAEVVFEAPGLGLDFRSGTLSRGMADGHPRITARDGSRVFEVTVTERLCTDTMTGMPFPVGIEASLDGQRFSGCGGETMTAIEGGWRVIRLGGDMLPEGVTATIVFGTDGRVSGRTGCNRFTGAYTLTGEGLAFGSLAVTRMACPPHAMEAERRFLDLVQRVTRVTAGEAAQLRLMAGDEQALVLDRAD